MLVLGRKLGETFTIGPDVAVTVVKIDRGKVRLAIAAPREIEIWREELLPKVRARQAAGGEAATP